jgi:hypothetical protein
VLNVTPTERGALPTERGARRGVLLDAAAARSTDAGAAAYTLRRWVQRQTHAP